MNKILGCLALLAPTLSVLADAALPRDVQKFVDRREGCDHMRGEMPDSGEKHRLNEASRQIGKLCKGTDKQLTQLKTKYASNRPVMQRLNEFDQGIEAEPPKAKVAKNGAERQAH